jgi:hypothetical protein
MQDALHCSSLAWLVAMSRALTYEGSQVSGALQVSPNFTPESSALVACAIIG